MPEQNLVSNILDVIKNIEVFNRECKEDIEGAKSVIRNCNYYVGFDGKFASVKFAAWQDVNLNKYREYREIDNDEFHARTTQKALEELGVNILNDMDTINQFLAWSSSSRLNVQYTDGKTKIYYIDNIVPLKVKTTTQKKIVDASPEKGNYELWAPSRFAGLVPETKRTSKIIIGDKAINVARQYNADNEIVYGTCSGDYNSIRELIFKYDLKLSDMVYLHVINSGSEYRLLIDEKEVDSVSFDNTKKVIQSVIDNGINYFKSFVTTRGYSFSDEVVANYIFSLKAKPFVILSGISGTGKTKIAQLFAEYMCPDEVIEVVQGANEDELIYKVPKYFIKYNRIVLQNRIADLIQTQIGEKSNVLNINFDGIIGKCSYGYAGSKSAKHIIFSGEIAKHVKKDIKIGDYIKIYLTYEDDEETLVFKKIDPNRMTVTQKSNRYSFISVRPDWTDNKSLLGFYNPITESYQPTELLKLMLRAKEDKVNPYFVILDEMNLAKVEHYFSDFLSCLESRRLNSEGNIVSESIILHDVENSIPYEDADGREYLIPNRLEIPLNIYFTGTVNVDETTYMFSPKVLDRANVIEFNEVNMSKYRDVLYSKGSEKSEVNNTVEQDFIEYFTDQGRYNLRLIKKEFNKELGWCYDKLIELNSILYDYHMHFGYRVIDEIMMYLSYGYEYHSSLVEVDLDIQILQKVLPKMHGNRKQLEIPLSRLIRYCFNADYSVKDKALSLEEKGYVVKYSYDSLIETQYIKTKDEVFNKHIELSIKEEAEPIFPRSARKLARMYSMLENQGYTSFIE